MRISPRAVVFDYGNVLCAPQRPTDVAAMASVLQLPVDRFEELYWRDRLAYDQAAFEPAAYWNKLASRTLTAAEIERLNELDGVSWTHPNPAVPQWAGQLRKAGIRTAILSNMPATIKSAVERTAWLPQFDDRTYSCDLRTTKPSPEIYEHCLNHLGVAPGDALFLDDREPNVRGAEQLGIHALLFTNPAQASVELQQRFALPVPLIATL